MPNPWTGKGNPYTREEVRARLDATLKKNQAISYPPSSANARSAPCASWRHNSASPSNQPMQALFLRTVTKP